MELTLYYYAHTYLAPLYLETYTVLDHITDFYQFKDSDYPADYNGSVSDFVIPKVFNGKDVIGIKSEAFVNISNVEDVKELDISFEYLVWLEKGSLAGLSHLESLTINLGGNRNILENEWILDLESSVGTTNWGYVAYYCDKIGQNINFASEYYYLNQYFLVYTAYESEYILPTRCSVVSDNAFYSHEELTTVTIPSDYTHIKVSAFNN